VGGGSGLVRRRGSPWVTVGVGFVALFTAWGALYSFGAFFEPMARAFHAGSGATAGVFGVTGLLAFGLGALTGPLADRLGPRPLLLAGAAATGAGLTLTAVAAHLWTGYLTYGLGVGVGTACVYVPTVAAVGGWFQRRRSLAIGITVSGIGVGTLVLPPLAALAINRLGWREAELALGLGTLAVLVGCAIASRKPPVRAAAAGPGLGLVLRARAFQLLYAAGLLDGFALFVALVHLVPSALQMGVQPVPAAALIGLVGAGSAGGRLLLGGLAERAGPVRSLQLAAALLAISFIAWLFASGYGALALFALALGVGYGGTVALTPSVVAELYGAGGMGGSVGVLYTSAGIGALVGPTLAGVLVDVTGGYRPAILCALALAILATVALLPLPARPVRVGPGPR
jgi:MFS family permease